MKSRCLLAVAWLLMGAVFLGASLARADDPAGYALIYNGPGSADGAPEALGSVAAQAGLAVRYVSDAGRIASLLDGAVLLGIGGTEDDIEALRRLLVESQKAAIQDFVRRGGRFLGVCGGAYLASQGWEETWGWVDGLGLAPAVTEVWAPDMEPRIIHVVWQGADRAMYYQGGPVFILGESTEAVEVVATYADGSLAAFLCTMGQGKVLLIGPHPEADWSWLDEDELYGTDWTPTQSLAVAIIQDLVSSRTLVTPASQADGLGQ